MKMQILNGGLANQAFQYIFARYIEMYTNEPCYLDDSTFWLDHVAHNGFELDRVFPNTKLHLLSNEFPENVWKGLVAGLSQGHALCQQFKDQGTNFLVINDHNECIAYNGSMIKVPSGVYLPNLVLSKGNIYFNGYWGGKHWLNAFFDMFLQELAFPPLTDKKNIDYKTRIEQCNSIAVHIRRGDFVKLGWQVSNSYYYENIKKIKEIDPDAVIFVFSDDMDYCRTHADELGLLTLRQEPIYIEGNTNDRSYIDMQLMTYCKGYILCKSGFSYLAALLNRNPNKLVFLMNYPYDV